MNAPLRILVVDDEPDLLIGTARLLEKAGYAVDRAANGEQALQAVRDHRPDLLLLDRDLPDIDGTEVCRRIRQDPAVAGSFVIIISGSYTESDEQAEGLESGADGYITRPIANRELLARVAAFVRILHLTRSLRLQAEELMKSGAAASQARLASLNLMEDAVAARDRLEIANQALRNEITVRKRAEQSLQENTDFLRTLLETIPVPVFYKDVAGRYLGSNRAFEAFFGKQQGELVGKTIFDIVPRELAEVCHARDLALLRGSGVQADDRQVADTRGLLHDVVFHKAAFKAADGKVGGMIGVILDITERKQAEARLQAQLEELQRWHKLTLGRETRVIALKREVNALRRRLGEPAPYPSQDGGPSDAGAVELPS